MHRLIVDAFVEAGFPPGVVNFIAHSAADAPAVVEALIAHPAVKRVNFTGSSRVGRIIGELSGKHLKPCLLELGGKAPFIVLEDADLDEAVAAAAFGAFMHQGQICMSTERIIVVERIADEFLKRFTAKVKTLQMGDPTKGNFPIGACVDGKTVDHVKALISDATGKGAKVLVGGNGPGGAFFEPTVVDNVQKGMRLYGEESFGPVVGVIRARDADHAVELANDSEYGLSAAVFSQNINTALSVAQRIDSGICHINSPTVQDEAQMPFGGTKAQRRRPLRRQGGRRRVHRPALDQHLDEASALPDLKMDKELSVVVPVCNEAENVAPLAREIASALAGREYEMIFVDDGSTDDTRAVLDRLRSEGLDRLRIMRHSFRSGQSAAVATGVRAARGALDRDARRRRPERSGRHSEAARRARPAGERRRAAVHGQSHDAPRHRLPAPAVAHRQRRSRQPARRRHAGHRLRHQAVRARRVPRPALLRSHASLPAGAVPARGATASSRCRSAIDRASAASPSTACSTGCGSASSTSSA